jgi:hypothetical protein
MFAGELAATAVESPAGSGSETMGDASISVTPAQRWQYAVSSVESALHMLEMNGF